MPPSGRRTFLERGIRALSRVAPAWRRTAWRDEWLAELAASRSTPSAGDMARCAAGALAHLAWLWSREWSVTMMSSDLRFAVRTLFRRPAFAITAVVTLILGIGATTAMFTIVNAVLLRPLPFAHADRLVTIWPATTFAPGGLAAAEEGRGAFDAVGAYSGWGMTITGGAQAEMVDGARVSPSLFTVLGVAPIAGRVFEADEDRAGRDGVVVVSEGFARRRFGSPQAAIGGRLTVNGQSCEVIGVMPASFAFPDRRSDMWAPITVEPSRSDYTANFASLLGRRAPGVSLAEADARMRAYAESLRRDQPKQYGEKFLQRAVLEPLQRRLVRDVRTPLLLLFGSVGILLVIACANIGVLMLTRAAARQGEIAVRAAMGASRLRVVRQLLVESLLISVIGGAGGVVLAFWLVRLAVPLVPADLPYVGRAAIDGQALLFAGLTVIGSALFFGLVPAVQLSRGDVRALLSSTRGTDRGQSGRRARTGLVFVELALATLLVIAAALLGRSFVGLSRVPIGFDADAVLTLRASAPTDRYKDDAQVTMLFGEVLARVARAPGVERAGAIHLLPLTPDNWNPGVTIDGAEPADQYPSDVNWRVVTPGYFAAMGVPLRRGRQLSPQDDAGAEPVAVVNDAFVHAVFRDRDPIGRRIRTAFEAKGTWATIVGVVGNLHQHTIEDPASPEMYRPFAQHPLEGMHLMVRTTGDPTAAAPGVRAAIAAIDPDVVLTDVEPMAQVVDRLLGSRRVPMAIAALFAIAAMTLGLVGVTGVLSFDVAERRREIGIRLALGASPGRVERAFLGRGLRLAIGGVLAGVAVALVASRALQSLLFGLSATDPATIVVVGLGFTGVVLLASYAPARRASRVDPLETLRNE